MVLAFGLRASHVPSASGEVAMQMFVLSFPSSMEVGKLLNALNGLPGVQSRIGVVLYA